MKYLFFDVLPCLLRPEVCCGRWKVRSTVINTVDHNSNSDSNLLLTTDLEDCNVIKGWRRNKEWHRVSEKDQGARLMLTNQRTCWRRQIDKNRTWQLCQLDKRQHLVIFWLVQDNNRTSPINRTCNVPTIIHNVTGKSKRSSKKFYNRLRQNSRHNWWFIFKDQLQLEYVTFEVAHKACEHYIRKNLTSRFCIIWADFALLGLNFCLSQIL